METPHPPNPAALPSGTEVGPWRVVSLSGRGSYGTVYRAERIGQEQEGLVALKVAKHPLDPRFGREAELLSRMRLPHVPQLLDHGWWRGPGGSPYPFIVMQWIEGVPLYAWAAQPGRTWGQAVRVLTQVASALAATHAVDGVHRDAKGENVLVRQDGTAVLLDFGSGDWLGAPTLTRPGEPPGTPQYWSPESLRFQWEHRRDQTAHYEAGSADDVYALGMLAWKLMVGSYPPPAPEPKDLGEGSWLSQPVLLPPRALAGAGPELKALILRMLSSKPGARGSAADALQALERAVKKAGRKADRPLLLNQKPPSALRPTWALAPRRRGLMLAAAALLMAFGLWRVEPQPPGPPPEEVAQPAPLQDSKDAGTSELSDMAVTERVDTQGGRPVRKEISLDMPKGPLPGQRRPPCKPSAVAINGGCWRRLGDSLPPCDDDAYEWNNKCYLPLLAASRPPTSEPR